MVTDNERTKAQERARGTVRTQNRYCSTCLRTKRFIDLGATLQCSVCAKRLHRVEPRLPANVVARVA